jgi:hypothetical protein
MFSPQPEPDRVQVLTCPVNEVQPGDEVIIAP